MSGMKRKFGQGMIEYILITALVALASIAMFRAFRSDVEKAYKKAGQMLTEGLDQQP